MQRYIHDPSASLAALAQGKGFKFGISDHAGKTWNDLLQVDKDRIEMAFGLINSSLQAKGSTYRLSQSTNLVIETIN